MSEKHSLDEQIPKELWAIVEADDLTCMNQVPAANLYYNFETAIREAKDIARRKRLVVCRVTPYATFTPKEPELKVMA